MDAASPVFILTELIRRQSDTPNDGGCFAFAESLLKPLGFHCQRMPFAAPGTPDVDNLYAKRAGKSGKSRHLLFNGHVDTVPAGRLDTWRFPPFAAEQADGFIFGRGAADMKGGIACFIAALARLLAKKPDLNGAISVLLTADEEGPAINGTEKALRQAHASGEKWDAALVGEPSSDKNLGDRVRIGCRGSLSAVLRVKGAQGHVAYPHQAQNPLPWLLHLLRALTEKPLDSGNQHFQPSNLELTSIDTGNSTTNIIPAQAEARFNIRLNSCWMIASLKQELRARLSLAAAASDSSAGRYGAAIDYDLDFVAHPSEAFYTTDKALVPALEQSIAAITGKKPQLSTHGGTSDARFIKDYCPVAELGLIGATIHKANECAALEDLEKLTEIYEHFMQNFFAA